MMQRLGSMLAVRRPARLALLGATLLVLAGWLVRRRHPLVGRAVIDDPEQSTVIGEDGAVRSVQAAELILPSLELERIWSPMHLERLARTYWRFLQRVTLGLIRVLYTEEERIVVLLLRPLRLLRFQKPEYEMDANRGVVRWRIEDGILVDTRGRSGDGFLQIDVERRGCAEAPGCETLQVEVEVANFYPSLAFRFGKWFYAETQSRIHVLVTHGFLRSLARLDLSESRVGRFADAAPAPAIADVPDPPPSGERSPRRAQPAAGAH